MTPKPVAFITGAGRGIGRGISLELIRSGYDVAGNDIIYEPENFRSGLFEVKKKAEELAGVFWPVAGDVAELKDHDKMIEAVLKKFGRMDALINNAGVSPEKRLDILETTPESYDRLMSINARGPFFLTQKVARMMLTRLKTDPAPKPCLIFITSISAAVSSTSRAEYCVSKAALSQTAMLFADRLAEAGINVYEVRPGIIASGMTAPVQEKYDKLIADGLVPQRRWGFPEDVGKAVAALARGDFGYSTGLILELSGGMNIRRL
jgi:NAD(P)-dependent dehydrogenase (short-subunit alcohol dehydrogenase family)